MVLFYTLKTLSIHSNSIDGIGVRALKNNKRSCHLYWVNDFKNLIIEQ